MKNYRIYLLAICLFAIFTRCDILDRQPLTAVNEEDVWNKASLATQYLNNLYNLMQPSWQGTTNATLSDEVYGDVSLTDLTALLMYGNLTKDAAANISGAFSNDEYAKIRRANILLEDIEKGSIPFAEKQVIKAQAWFLRAYTYWKMVNLHGGVPMIMNVQMMSTDGTVTEDILRTRDKTSVCIDLICQDLDSAARYLPASWGNDDYGRVTRGAAMALKGRILLFWASPQFNPQDKQDRWTRAYQANRGALDTLIKDGHGLVSLKDLFTDCKEKTAEAVWVRVYDANIAGSYYHNYDNTVRPYTQSLAGGKSNHATWDLVESFPMKDGYNTDTVEVKMSAYTYYGADYDGRQRRTTFWQDRDPRLEAFIAWNSCTWPLSGDANHKLWTYRYPDGTSWKFTEGTNYSRSSFYCRKYVNPSIQKTATDKIGTDWNEIRFAEVLLNLAECANEKGLTSEAVGYIKQIRDRAGVGMGNISAALNKNAMRRYIMQERQIELCFENKRHWDLRRRNMFATGLPGYEHEKLNGKRRCGWIIELNPARVSEGTFLLTRDNLTINSSNYASYFNRGYKDTLDIRFSINYQQPLYNFYPIPQTNLEKNERLEQNYEWGGTFDPLAE